MKKILVTTDFSTNSKAGIRYAIQLAKQGGFKLRFIHVYHRMKPTQWPESRWKSYLEEETDALMNQFAKFMQKTVTAEDMGTLKFDLVLERGVSASETILEHALNNGFDCICLSTLGAGTVRKLLGTHTSWLLKNSKLPLLVIPKSSRKSAISKVLYLSDRENLREELKAVTSISKSIEAGLTLLHFKMADALPDMESQLQREISKATRYPVELKTPQRNLMNTLQEDITLSLKKIKPDLVVMYTRRQKGFFESLFNTANTQAFADAAKYPLLAMFK